MIPAIGLMIAAYIVTRMIHLFMLEQSILIKILSVITILVAVICAYELLASGSNISDQMLTY